LVGQHVLTVDSPVGRKARPKFLVSGTPLIRTKRSDLVAAGVELLPRTTDVYDGFPALDDGRILETANVIWCTGFQPGLDWIDLHIFGDDGRPVHRRGVVPEAAGLFFVGLPFQYAATSDVFPGVGRDAEYIADQIATRVMSNAGHHPTAVLDAA
jgi:putative flavoprotein involved in K+ transport